MIMTDSPTKSDEEVIGGMLSMLPSGRLMTVRIKVEGCTWPGCSQGATEVIAIFYPDTVNAIPTTMCADHAERTFLALEAATSVTPKTKH